MWSLALAGTVRLTGSTPLASTSTVCVDPIVLRSNRAWARCVASTEDLRKKLSRCSREVALRPSAGSHAESEREDPPANIGIPSLVILVIGGTAPS